MSRLKKLDFHGHSAWQWDNGPIFISKDAKELAIEYGKVIQHLETLEELAKLIQLKILTKDQINKLHVIS